MTAGVDLDAAIDRARREGAGEVAIARAQRGASSALRAFERAAESGAADCAKERAGIGAALRDLATAYVIQGASVVGGSQHEREKWILAVCSSADAYEGKDTARHAANTIWSATSDWCQKLWEAESRIRQLEYERDHYKKSAHETWAEMMRGLALVGGRLVERGGKFRVEWPVPESLRDAGPKG